MRVYITGVAGFLGSHLADYWIEQGAEVSGLDNLSGGNLKNIPEKLSWFVNDDITMPGVIVPKNVDILYHCAAAPYEGVSVFSPYYISENIYSGSINVFKQAINAGVKRIVFCSSMARYGNITAPYSEFRICDPQDPYGIAKKASEDVLKCLAGVHEFDYTIAVPHNIYGPRQKYDDPYRNVASIMVNRMLQGKQPIIYGDGNQVRCFSYISDCISCLGKMGIQNDVLGEVINIGPDEEFITINKLAEILAEIIGFENLDPIYYHGRPTEVKEARCLSQLARVLLEYKTETSLKKGMSMLVDWIISNGPKPFQYNHVPLEIINEKIPKTWINKEI